MNKTKSYIDEAELKSAMTGTDQVKLREIISLMADRVMETYTLMDEDKIEVCREAGIDEAMLKAKMFKDGENAKAFSFINKHIKEGITKRFFSK